MNAICTSANKASLLCCSNLLCVMHAAVHPRNVYAVLEEPLPPSSSSGKLKKKKGKEDPKVAAAEAAVIAAQLAASTVVRIKSVDGLGTTTICHQVGCHTRSWILGGVLLSQMSCFHCHCSLPQRQKKCFALLPDLQQVGWGRGRGLQCCTHLTIASGIVQSAIYPLSWGRFILTMIYYVLAWLSLIGWLALQVSLSGDVPVGLHGGPLLGVALKRMTASGAELSGEEASPVLQFYSWNGINKVRMDSCWWPAT